MSSAPHAASSHATAATRKAIGHRFALLVVGRPRHAIKNLDSSPCREPRQRQVGTHQTKPITGHSAAFPERKAAHVRVRAILRQHCHRLPKQVSRHQKRELRRSPNRLRESRSCLGMSNRSSRYGSSDEPPSSGRTRQIRVIGSITPAVARSPPAPAMKRRPAAHGIRPILFARPLRRSPHGWWRERAPHATVSPWSR